MEEVYVVKVKTRPEPSKLYPSERRYSAITVGGLGLVHALLAITSILLASLGIVAEGVAASYGAGIALGVASFGAAVVGVLAWRRWYVDNNIRYFLVTSVVSGAAAIICIVLTAIAIATMQEELAFNRLTTRNKPLELPVPLPLVADDATYGGDDELQSNNTELIEKFIQAFENHQNRSDFKNILANETYLLRLDENGSPKPEEEPQVDDENDGLLEDAGKTKKETDSDMTSSMDDGDSRASPTPTTSDVSSSILYNSGEVELEATSNVLSVNILIASLLELAWSLLSIRIAWKGMTSDYPNDEPGRVVVGSEHEKTSYLPKFMRSVRTTVARRPDILSSLKSRDDGRKSSVAVVSDEMEHYLPQQESTIEYHERVRKFLASNNQNSC